MIWTWLCAGRVVDLGTGEYTAKFTATSAGAYSVSIKHNGCNIAGSPFPAEVLHTGIAADCSYVVQEGLERAVSGQQVTGNSPSLTGHSTCIIHTESCSAGSCTSAGWIAPGVAAAELSCTMQKGLKEALRGQQGIILPWNQNLLATCQCTWP